MAKSSPYDWHSKVVILQGCTFPHSTAFCSQSLLAKLPCSILLAGYTHGMIIQLWLLELSEPSTLNLERRNLEGGTQRPQRARKDCDKEFQQLFFEPGRSLSAGAWRVRQAGRPSSHERRSEGLLCFLLAMRTPQQAEMPGVQRGCEGQGADPRSLTGRTG